MNTNPQEHSHSSAKFKSKSQINYSIDSHNRSFTLRVDRTGSDLSSQIEALRGHYENEAVELVILYLNMNDPNCPGCYEKFRDEGFIFSGCLPGSSSGDYMILQNLKGRQVVKGKDKLEANYMKLAETFYEINGL